MNNIDAMNASLRKLRIYYGDIADAIKKEFYYLPIANSKYNKLVDECLEITQEDLNNNVLLDFACAFGQLLTSKLRYMLSEAIKTDLPRVITNFLTSRPLDMELIRKFLIFLDEHGIYLTEKMAESLTNNNKFSDAFTNFMMFAILKYPYYNLDKNYICLSSVMQKRQLVETKNVRMVSEFDRLKEEPKNPLGDANKGVPRYLQNFKRIFVDFANSGELKFVKDGMNLSYLETCVYVLKSGYLDGTVLGDADISWLLNVSYEQLSPIITKINGMLNIKDVSIDTEPGIPR